MKLIFLSFSIFILSFSSKPWILEHDKNEIKAYARIQQGKDYYEFKTNTRVNASIKQVVGVLMNVAKFKEWMPSTLESKVLKQKSSHEKIAYTLSSVPWPMSSRDLVFSMKLSYPDKNSAKIELEGLYDYIPHNKDHVRVKDYKAVWTLKYKGGKTFVEHYVSFDPDTSASMWMIKNSMVKARVSVLEGLKEELEK